MQRGRGETSAGTWCMHLLGYQPTQVTREAWTGLSPVTSHIHSPLRDVHGLDDPGDLIHKGDGARDVVDDLDLADLPVGGWGGAARAWAGCKVRGAAAAAAAAAAAGFCCC